MADILNQVYEPRFLDCSMGFRPNRSAHDTVAYINQVIMCRKVNYVLEADIRGFFDNVNHDWMMKFLANDIDDKNFLRYVKRFLIAGIMEGTEYHESDKGTPQGGQISPILANVYLHYVLDLWVTAVKKHIRGQIYYVRYADDFIIMFQYWDDACSLPRKTQKTDTQNEKNAPEHHVQERFFLPINGVSPLFYPFNFPSILATCCKICLSVSLSLVPFFVSSFGLSVVVVAFFENPFSPAALIIAG